MAVFSYRGRGKSGQVLEGRVEAITAGVAANQLLTSGITPLDISEVAAPQGTSSNLVLFEKRPQTEDLILFTRQLHTMLRAGVPINQSIAALARSTRNRVMARTLDQVLAQIESGRELSVALSGFPRIFPALVVALVRVGENSGQLDAALLRLSQYLETEKDTQRRVNSALRYPMMVIATIVIAVGIINYFVIPAFAQVFERSGVALPLPTRIIVGTSQFVVDYWLHMVVVIVVVILSLRAYVQTDSGRMMWDRLKLKLPVVGGIVNRATLSRFSRAFAMSLRSGVPLIQAIAVTSRAVGNVFVGERLSRMRTGVERGETLTRTATNSRMFTPLVLQMLSVGEETGAIDEMMDEVADYYEREVDYDVKNLSQAIEPILIVVVAGLVLVLALGVFLPLWDLATVKLAR